MRYNCTRMPVAGQVETQLVPPLGVRWSVCTLDPGQGRKTHFDRDERGKGLQSPPLARTPIPALTIISCNSVLLRANFNAHLDCVTR